MNELEKKAWAHHQYNKKHPKGLPSPWLTKDNKKDTKVNKDAGDVETSINHFNSNMSNSGGEGCCEAYEGTQYEGRPMPKGKQEHPTYKGEYSKDEVNGIFVDGIEFPTDDEAYEYIRERDKDRMDESTKRYYQHKRIIEGLKKLDMYCIDNRQHYWDLRGLYESVCEELSSQSRDDLERIINDTDDPDVITAAIGVMNTKDEHPGQDLADIHESLLDENKIELSRVSDFGLGHFTTQDIVDVLKNAEKKQAQYLSLILRGMTFEAKTLTKAGRDAHIIKVQRWYNIALFPSENNTQTQEDRKNGLIGPATGQPAKGVIGNDAVNAQMKAIGLNACILTGKKNGLDKLQVQISREKDTDPNTGKDTGRGAPKCESHYYSIDSSDQIIREYTPQELIDNGYVSGSFGKVYGNGYVSLTREFNIDGIIDILAN